MANITCTRCGGTGRTRWLHVEGGICFACRGAGTLRSVRRNPRPAPKPPVEDIRIEFPSAGATYSHQEWGVYKYDVWPRSSVLAGQQRRQYIGSYTSLHEAQAAFPTARQAGCGYQPPYLGHLPEEEDSW